MDLFFELVDSDVFGYESREAESSFVDTSTVGESLLVLLLTNVKKRRECVDTGAMLLVGKEIAELEPHQVRLGRVVVESVATDGRGAAAGSLIDAVPDEVSGIE